MKSTMKYYLLTLCLALSFILWGQTSYAQCDMKFDYTVEHCSKDQKDGKIFITVRNGEAPYTFKLFDMYGGTYEFLAVKEVKRISPSGKILLFEHLPPSSYRIQIVGNQCKLTIGGVDGITINQKEK